MPTRGLVRIASRPPTSIRHKRRSREQPRQRRDRHRQERRPSLLNATLAEDAPGLSDIEDEDRRQPSGCPSSTGGADTCRRTPGVGPAGGTTTGVPRRTTTRSRRRNRTGFDRYNVRDAVRVYRLSRVPTSRSACRRIGTGAALHDVRPAATGRDSFRSSRGQRGESLAGALGELPLRVLYRTVVVASHELLQGRLRRRFRLVTLAPVGRDDLPV